MKVAIQGELGSNSHVAAIELLGEQEIVCCTVSKDVFDSLADRRADVAVLPIENSLHGSVAEHYDLLLAQDVVTLAELRLHVHHALIVVPGTSMESIRKVLSHPVALSQCRRFFAAHPEMAPTSFYDTAGSVKYLMEEKPIETAAIARTDATRIYGAEVLECGLEDDPLNVTRFFMLATSQRAEEFRPHIAADKMSVAFAVEHKPGSLVGVLQQLAALGVDLTRIESRPVPGRPWEYIFYVDLRFPTPDTPDHVAEILQKQCHMFKEIGRYAAAR
ncbi:MAG: prephenate dehydratase [Acidobacteria bacterium]|nr:prephenate dehydratase [Acidobacteriota bacterium]